MLFNTTTLTGKLYLVTASSAPQPRLAEVAVLCGLHLMLTHAGWNNRFAARLSMKEVGAA